MKITSRGKFKVKHKSLSGRTGSANHKRLKQLQDSISRSSKTIAFLTVKVGLK